MRALLLLAVAVPFAMSEIRTNPGGKELPHDKYVHVVSDSASPVERVYVQTKDGLYVAAAMRKPRGAGPFPVLLYFHGAPGGRGMDKLVTWSRGDTGGPLWERFLQEGYVVIVADYRNPARMDDRISRESASYADDAVAILQYARGLSYVDRNRIAVYGVSLGGNVALHLLSREKVAAAILGAPAPLEFLGVTSPAGQGSGPDRFKGMTLDKAYASTNIASISTPVLILVGTSDSLIALARPLHDMMADAGKNVRMEIYENGYHDFVAGPQGHAGRKEPLLDATLDALEKSVAFLKQHLR